MFTIASRQHQVLFAASSIAAVAAALVGDGSKTAHHDVFSSNPRGLRNGILTSIGNTPLIELHTLSKATGCRILAKCEQMNPGGSVKDRAALAIIEAAERRGELRSGGTIVEGTGGNTGVGLSLVGAARGYHCVMVMPQSIAKEKQDAMRVFGAEVVLTPPVPITDERHYFNVARRLARERSGGFFANQFENLDNLKAHVQGTGPEIWRQTNGEVDAFICSCGTGGTLAGTSRYLKSVKPEVKCFIVDPPGSALLGYVSGKSTPKPTEAHGVTHALVPPAPGDTIAEGIGTTRITRNFSRAQLDGGFRVTNQEALDMAFYLKEREGVLVGASAATNVCGAVKLSRSLGPGHTIVTILCDDGSRYASTLFNDEWLAEKGLKPTHPVSLTV